MPTLTPLPAEVVARRAADLPHVVGRNVAGLASTIAWRSTGRLDTGSTIDRVGYPGRRAGDGSAIEPTAPSTVAASHDLCIDLGAPRAFDVVALLGAAELSGAATVEIEAADDPAFTVDLTSLVTLAVAPRRQVAWELAGSEQSVTARYVRARVSYASTGQVEIAELWLGSRLALRDRSLLPVDLYERPLAREAALWTSDAGTTSIVPRARARIDGQIEWWAPPDEASALVAWGASIEWGRHAALYAPRPSSARNAAAVVRVDELDIAEVHAGQTVARAQLVEQVPSLAAEGL